MDEIIDEMRNTIASQDAEITRLTAALARVRGQRDAMAEYLSDDADLVEEFGLRIVNGMVEEIEA